MSHVIICKMTFGSHLYGTATPSSDKDIKGVFIPPLRDILLARSSRNLRIQNSEEDSEMFSLQEFVKLALEGQTIAFDMLHAPLQFHTTSEIHPVWKSLMDNRHLFYTKKPKAFIGYARTQASKYGDKGAHLRTCIQFRDFLRSEDSMAEMVPESDARLKDCWDRIPELPHTHKIDPPAGTTGRDAIRQFQICGKLIQETVTLPYAIGVVSKLISSFGERAKQAETNDGVDWKAVSHAYRVASEIKELLQKKTITLPLPNAEYVLAVKMGRVPMSEFQPGFISLLNEVEELAANSELPSEPDRDFWDSFVEEAVMKYALRNNTSLAQ